MKKPIPYFQVDAFTNHAFAGNPAAVCLLDTERETDWMQAVAAEIGLSETAFLVKHKDDYSLRWFTPTTEVDLCGHATLSAAHILWEQAILAGNKEARFHTHSGLLTAIRNHTVITLDFPATPVEPTVAPSGLLAALGLDHGDVYRSHFDYMVIIDDAETLRNMSPDFSALGRVPTRGVIVSASADINEFDFISRFFAPSSGINEDSVTGSAHCALGPWWAAQLGKHSLTALQASRRGGVVLVDLEGDRVRLGGEAVTILSGELHV